MASKPVRRDLAPLRASDAPSLRRLARWFGNHQTLLATIASKVVDKVAERLEAQQEFCRARFPGEVIPCQRHMDHPGMHDDGTQRWV